MNLECPIAPAPELTVLAQSESQLSGDVRCILDFLLELHIPCNVESLWMQVSSNLSQVIPSAFTACNQVSLGGRRISTFYTSRPYEGINEMQQIAHKHFYEHVLFIRYIETRKSRAYKLSDFLTKKQVNRLEGLYQKTLRMMGLEDQMLILLPVPSTSAAESQNQDVVQSIALRRSIVLGSKRQRQ